MTSKHVVLVIACAGLLFAYQYALVLGTGYALALPPPSGWRASFPTHLSGSLTWLILVHTFAVLIVSVPFALLIARFGGPRAPVIALAITAALFALFSLPPFIEFFGIMSPRTRVVTAFDQIKLILVLPVLVWLMRKLPSNNR